MPRESLPSAARKNLEIIARVEQQLLQKQSRLERLGRAVARFFGSAGFLIAHGIFLAGWALVNTGALPRVRPFDPYPFPFLSLLVSVEFILLTTFVLMNQKYEMRRSEQWAHLHLQLSMLTEQEVTKNMQMLSQVCRRLGLGSLNGDDEVRELARPTPVSAFVGEIEKSLEAAVSGLAGEEAPPVEAAAGEAPAGPTAGGAVAQERAKVRRLEEKLVRQSPDDASAGEGRAPGTGSETGGD